MDDNLTQAPRPEAAADARGAAAQANAGTGAPAAPQAGNNQAPTSAPPAGALNADAKGGRTLDGVWRGFLPALGITVVLVAVFLALFGMRYEVNDDATISNIAAGAYGQPTQYLVYVNVLLGWLLKPFYALVPALNWFVILSFTLAIPCFALIGALLIRKMGLAGGCIAYALFMLLAGQDFFIRFHYVKYAALFVALGVLLLALDLGRFSYWSVIGIALTLVGSMLRFQQFMASGGMGAALLLFLFFKLGKPQKRRGLLAVLVMLAVCLAAKGADWAAYRFTDGWREYQSFNTVRTEISDYKLHFSKPLFDAGDYTFLEPLGMTPVDFEVVDKWLYYDPDVFTQSRLEEISAGLPGNSLGVWLKASLKFAFAMLCERPIHLCFSLVLLAWVFYSGKRRWPALLGTLGLLGAMLLYLNWHGRYIQRVDYALVLTAIIYLAACFEWAQPPKVKSLLFASALMALFIVPAWQGLYAQAQDYWASHPPRAAHLDKLSQDKNTLYLFDADYIDAAAGFDVWHARPEGYFSNIVFVGSWLMESPFQEEVLAEWGLENPWRDAIDREDVVVVDLYHPALRQQYLNQQYDPGALVQQIGEGESYNLYRYISGQAAAAVAEEEAAP